jgi:poly(3-hydroxybutyrate) depolymerase
MADDGVDNDSMRFMPDSVVQMPPVVSGGFPYSVSSYLNTAGELVVQHVLVSGLDHHWSGGAATAGRTAEPYGPDATAMVWAFFKRRAK